MDEIVTNKTASNYHNNYVFEYYNYTTQKYVFEYNNNNKYIYMNVIWFMH